VDDESSDEEEKMRKSMYEAESDVENEPYVEEQAYSKATRRSIAGFVPKKSIIPNSDQSSDSEDSMIIEESDDEEPKRSQLNPMGNPAMSSTIRTPLKELSDNVHIVEDSFESGESPDGSTSTSKRAVSRSQYDQVLKEKEALEQKKLMLESSKKLMKSLPDGGRKIMMKMEEINEELNHPKLQQHQQLVLDQLQRTSSTAKSTQRRGERQRCQAAVHRQSRHGELQAESSDVRGISEDFPCSGPGETRRDGGGGAAKVPEGGADEASEASAEVHEMAGEAATERWNSG
jgi:hypothetical protein